MEERGPYNKAPLYLKMAAAIYFNKKRIVKDISVIYYGFQTI